MLEWYCNGEFMLRKTVLITGATGGIGSALVKKFAEAGYNIIATYNNGDITHLQNICKKCEVDLQWVKIDFAKVGIAENMLTKVIADQPALQCVICNAGISLGEKMLIDTSLDEINKIINVNLTSVILCNKIAAKHFLGQKSGNIINIASIYGIYGGSCEAVYSASKAGVIGLSKALADGLGPYVRVNAIAPGYIQTAMTEGYSEQEQEEIKNRTPLCRLGKPESVADAALFLSSDEASFITGQVLEVSGGAIKF